MAIEPQRMQPEVPGGLDITQGIVADVQYLIRFASGNFHDSLKNGGMGFGMPNLFGIEAVMKNPLQRRLVELGGAVGH